MSFDGVGTFKVTNANGQKIYAIENGVGGSLNIGGNCSTRGRSTSAGIDSTTQFMRIKIGNGAKLSIAAFGTYFKIRNGNVRACYIYV